MLLHLMEQEGGNLLGHNAPGDGPENAHIPTGLAGCLQTDAMIHDEKRFCGYLSAVLGLLK